MNKKRKFYFVIVGIACFFVFIAYVSTSAIKKDEQHRYERKFHLEKYDTDKYAGKVVYDEQGAVPEASASGAGEEGTDWGEDWGIFYEQKDKNGKVVWKGISKEKYKNLTAEEQSSIAGKYAKIEEKLNASITKDLTEDTPIEDLLYNGTVYENIVSLCMEYNEGIPFSYKGRSYAAGFNLQKGGYDNSKYPVGEGYGLDGPGYLIWLYRNALGYTPSTFKGGISYAKLKNQEIGRTELQIGDICATSTADTDVVYGVVAGFSKGFPIISVCTNEGSSLFPYGCNHLCYIKDDKDEVLGNYSPINFTVFYRLDELKESK